MTTIPYIRHIDDLQHLAQGRWTINRFSHVTPTPRRPSLRLVGGDIIVVGEEPSYHVRLELADGGHVQPIVAKTVTWTESSYAFAHLHAVGNTSDIRGWGDVELDLDYHGVYRRGTDAWAWLTGTVRILQPRRHRFARSRTEKLGLDLFLDAPVGLDSSRRPVALEAHDRHPVSSGTERAA